ncbi:MAG TPA: VOC family protein [Candidatus Acidoferrum sp.]|nr:VOC family protein [Candidatus Acidoferrum sp.]
MVSKEKKQRQVIIGHVGIEASSLENARKFYEVLLKALGFRVILDSKESVGFSNGNFQIWLSEPMKQRFKCEAPTGEEFVVSEHVAILVPNRNKVDSVAKKMRDNGFDILFPPEEQPQFTEGYYATSFCDPDNHVIEVYTEPEKE